jgi:DNA sulfur modification protein DndD
LIFERIEILNLFSYRQAVFDLSGPVHGRNIALISGRNGYGKTSFLNAIKLLFVGPNADLCRAVQRGRELKPKEYVLGLGEEWLGIMNRQARRRGETRCEVRIRWNEPDGPVEALRRWDLSGGAYEETLELDRLGDTQRHLAGEDAQAFLGERLPEDYLSYFFYDGEQIQQLAEAARTQQIEQMERLLNISKIETLLEYLDKVAKSWRNEAAQASQRYRLCQLETELAAIEAKDAAMGETAQDLDREQDELERLIREEDRYLDDRRAASGDEGRLKSDVARLEAELESGQASLALALIPVAPLLVNTGPVRAGIEALERIVHSEAGSQAQALQAVLQDLPHDLFDKPPQSSPPLTDGQRRFYRNRLQGLLTAFIPSPADFLEGPLHLDSGHARELLALFQHFAQADQERLDRASDLRTLTQTKRRLADIRERLDDLSGLSGDEQQELRRRKAANDDRKKRIGAIDTELKLLGRQRQDLQRDRELKAKEIRDQERQVHLGEHARRKVLRAQDVRDFFVAYKDALRASKREALEAAVSQRFSELMTSHGMIRSIQVDDHFRLHFLDREGEHVAMGNLAAGMKQLMATSLLWALKEVSGKKVPLVIDTPLARIDRGHQENLLTRYYPFAGDQVIVLPTDSELDARKYALLAPHVYREYRLENPDGDDTVVVPGPIFRDVAEVANG